MHASKCQTVGARRCALALSAFALAAALAPARGSSGQQATTRGLSVVQIQVEDGSQVTLYEESYALVVGASAYDKDKGWPQLPGVRQDVAEVSAALKAHGFQVEEVLNPTRAGFEQAVWKFIGDHGQKASNRLLVYYAGHGATIKTEDGRDLGYLVPCDAPLPEKGKGAFKQGAVSMLEVINYANQIESKHALFVFDSCFSGSLFRSTMRSVPNHIISKMANPVRQFITAGTENQGVPDKSVFREQFVQALRGEADLNNDRYVTGTELGAFLEDRVTSYSRRAQTPQWGKIIDPELNKGDFVFSLLKPGETPPQPANAIEMAEVAKLVDAGELQHWVRIANSKDPEDYRAFLAKYPNGVFAPVARLRAQARGAAGPGDAPREAQRAKPVEGMAWRFINSGFSDSPLTFGQGRPAPTPGAPVAAPVTVSPRESWYVILGSYSLNRQDKANALMLKYQAKGYDAQLINTNWGDFPNFAPSLWVVVIGPSTQPEARKLMKEIRPTARDKPYIKQAVK